MIVNPLKHIFHRLLLIYAIVSIWRGFWILLDYFDFLYLRSWSISTTIRPDLHVPSALFGIVIGSIILYLLNKDMTVI